MSSNSATSPRASRAAQTRRWPALALSLVLFALAAATLAFAASLVIETLGAERAERVVAERNDEVLTALADLRRATIDAETGQRGYLLTLDRRYLAPYEVSRLGYPVALRRLRTLLDGHSDPRRDALLDQIDHLAAAHFVELARSVDLASDGRIIDAQQVVLSDWGQELMNELRATLGELERIERGYLTEARRDTATIEARLVPRLTLLLTAICLALALGLWQAVRAARAEVLAAQASALAEARDRADLLARELNHRVKNLFGVILGIVRMSARGDDPAKPAVERITRRIHALSVAHELTQGGGPHVAADLGELAERTLAPYRGDGHRCTFEGPAVALPSDQAVPLGLVLHELATNAVKYGAWSSAAGDIAVSWSRKSGHLTIDWRERCADRVMSGALASGGGFGTQLIDRAAGQLGGTITRSDHPDGIGVRIEFPLIAAETG